MIGPKLNDLIQTRDWGCKHIKHLHFSKIAELQKFRPSNVNMGSSQLGRIIRLSHILWKIKFMFETTNQIQPVNCIITPRQICSSWPRISKCGDRHGLSHTWQTDQWIKVTTTGTRWYEVPLSPEFHHFCYKMWDIIDILWQFLTISEIFWFDSEGLVKLWCASFPSPHSCTGLQIISKNDVLRGGNSQRQVSSDSMRPTVKFLKK